MSEPEIYPGLLQAAGVEVQPFRMHGDVAALFAAFAKAKGSFKPIVRSHENPFFKSKYAELSDVFAAVDEALSANGLALLQPESRKGDQWEVRTMLVHASGAYLEAVATLPHGGDWQKLGSAMTYCRRYCAGGMLGVAPEDDDDGNAASDAKPREQPPARDKSRPTPPPVEKRPAEQSKPNLRVAPPPEDEPKTSDNLVQKPPSIPPPEPTPEPYKQESFALLKGGTEELGFTKEFTREWCMKLIQKHPKDVTSEAEVQTLLADLKVRREAKG